jgi:hypothetical protein
MATKMGSEGDRPSGMVVATNVRVVVGSPNISACGTPAPFNVSYAKRPLAEPKTADGPSGDASTPCTPCAAEDRD